MPFGRDFFVNFVNFFIFPVFILGIYAVLKNLKLNMSSIYIGLAFFIYMPIVSHFFGFPHVEVFFTTTFVLSIYFLQEFWITKSIHDLWFFGLALGLFVGTKFLGIPYAFPLLLIVGVAILKYFFKDGKKLIGALFHLFGAGILGGGFLYAPNLI